MQALEQALALGLHPELEQVAEWKVLLDQKRWLGLLLEQILAQDLEQKLARELDRLQDWYLTLCPRLRSGLDPLDWYLETARPPGPPSPLSHRLSHRRRCGGWRSRRCPLTLPWIEPRTPILALA